MYEEIRELRRQVTDELKLELPQGIPFTTEHYRLVELRLQTALAVAARTISEELQVLNEEVRAEKAGDMPAEPTPEEPVSDDPKPIEPVSEEK